ncbi:MAG: hypothetical protein V7K14_14785 [Nostoc sp.]
MREKSIQNSRIQNSKLKNFCLLFPMPHAQCPMPNAQCPMPND